MQKARQLAWIGAAFRVPDVDRLSYSDLTTKAGKWPDRMDFSFQYKTVPVLVDKTSCWHGLFTRAVIARGFPVPTRNDSEIELELSLEMMAALGGARHALDFEGVLVVKGDSAMFVSISGNQDSIQWYLIRNSDGTRLRYRDVRSQCPKRAMLDTVDHESFKVKRAFLGWWSEAECQLGKLDANYEKLDWSTAKEVSRSTRVSGGALGFQNTMIGQINFAIGAKDSNLRSSVKGLFEMIMQCAERTSMVMYDQEDRRR